MNAVIIDDEKAARETLESYIRKYAPEVKILALADGLKSGIEAIKHHKPELVFLDVEMPYGNAFDLLDSFDAINFETIFVTAFSNYAIQALNMSAAFYLLKPVDIDELIAAITKVRQNIEEKNHFFHTNILIENFKNEHSQKKKIVLPMLNGFEIIKVEEIIRCQANDNFTEFHLLNKEKKLICRTLKHYSELLSPLGFLRVHKSHLINMQYVKRYIKGNGGQIIMNDDSEVELSIRHKKEFNDYFKN